MTGPQLTGFAVLLVIGSILALVGLVALFRLQASDDEVGLTLPLGVKINTKGGAVGVIAIGAALLVVAVYLAFGVDPAPTPTTTTQERGASTSSSAPTTEPSTTSQTFATTTSSGGGSDLTGCTATISNPFASIRTEPDPLAQEIKRIPAGTYPVVDTASVPFAGKNMLFLKLNVDGDEGWIVYDTILIASTSSQCDF
jgi:hypothetical protein